MIRIPIGNERSMRVEVRSVAQTPIPTWSCIRSSSPTTWRDAKIKNLRQAARYLPDNVYDALENFRKSDWTTKLPVKTSRAATPTSSKLGGSLSSLAGNFR